MTQPTWNTASGGVDFGYTISGAYLTTPAKVCLYWSADEKFDGNCQYTPAYFPVDTSTAQNTYSVPVNPCQFTPLPQYAKYLLAVINPDMSITESYASNYTNNVKALPVIPAPLVHIFASHSDDTLVTVYSATHYERVIHYLSQSHQPVFIPTQLSYPISNSLNQSELFYS